MKKKRIPRLKPLLDKVPPGFMVDTPWLRAQGIDPKSIHGYVARGWLERVVRGVYRRPLPEGAQTGPDSEWMLPLLSLQWIMGHDLHLGGENALDLDGYSHYLYLGGMPRTHVYGSAPSWLQRLPMRTNIVLHQRPLFGESRAGVVNADPDRGELWHAVNVGLWPIKASSPERAILEMLDELPGRGTFDKVDKIFEGLATLRPHLLMALLADCRSVKVRRLFFVYADRHQHAWRKRLDISKIDLGSGPRALVKGGKIHPTYRIYVPENLIPGNEEKCLY